MNNLDDGNIASRGMLNTQLEVVTAQIATERSRQEQEHLDSDRLPTRKELKWLIGGIEKKLKVLARKRKSSFSYAEYLQYCKYTIARIVTYNLRRSGEVATMSLKQFAHRSKGKGSWSLRLG